MKLFFDENISSKLVNRVAQEFPNSTHIDFLRMQGTTDTNIWEYAKTENYIIVFKDNDFRQRSFLLGFLSKVIWLSIGNGGTQVIGNLLLENTEQIKKFADNSIEGLLVLARS